MKIKKTTEIRAKELWRLVHAGEEELEFYTQNPDVIDGWKRLGRFVLSLENKWTKLKRERSTQS